MAFFLLFFCAALLSAARAYIPASPTNDTSALAAVQASLNLTDISQLQLQWYSNGSVWQNVTYELVGANSNGITQGAIVHFSEANLTNATTTTPWIALIACDFNVSYASSQDIFTLAGERGAVSALLYSVYSQACLINPAFSNNAPASFDGNMDIFSTQSLISSARIQYQFGQIGPQNESLYGSYNPVQLDASGAIVNQSLQTGYPVAPGYLIATLDAYNSSQGDNTTDSGSSSNQSNGNGGSGGSPNTSLAMIILYAITGCVSALFCVVIVSGAVRAIRHPERYGPRTGHEDDGYGPSQSRARGLTQAILDTISPVIKFGQNSTSADPAGSLTKDVEASGDNHSAEPRLDTRPAEMTEWEMMERHNASETDDAPSNPVKTNIQGEARPAVQNQAEITTETSTPVDGPSSSAGTKEVRGRPTDMTPAKIGTVTCPICIVDFEEGDDLRVLPCEGKHMFHQKCVDPWLLELSSSCPICREDFHALEAMLSGSSEEDTHTHRFSMAGNRDSFTGNRFSRYLRFARRRNNELEDHDITDPWMPPAPES